MCEKCSFLEMNLDTSAVGAAYDVAFADDAPVAMTRHSGDDPTGATLKLYDNKPVSIQVNDTDGCEHGAFSVYFEVPVKLLPLDVQAAIKRGAKAPKYSGLFK